MCEIFDVMEVTSGTAQEYLRQARGALVMAYLLGQVVGYDILAQGLICKVTLHTIACVVRQSLI
jgi:hypothetical protein